MDFMLYVVLFVVTLCLFVWYFIPNREIHQSETTGQRPTSLYHGFTKKDKSLCLHGKTGSSALEELNNFLLQKEAVYKESNYNSNYHNVYVTTYIGVKGPNWTPPLKSTIDKHLQQNKDKYKYKWNKDSDEVTIYFIKPHAQ
ncbi:uncharacterized protein LOC131939682 [Physella acuta]|uniref:uncharacterized protein LOC131939682 n=1 Tax=Physella acuta TaxID=109671 RepID=UPI0027DE141A|nr:uncharacterized protein LOC131939682 [Physella acuta]XP_059154124.1 uncharacterized protein LOC131939682 [Physella acuta]XP_059154125.1 uncharacterized protein LOC131939682 [Physella acuta]XP_059154126.1 uncharacterized protein LOC131939682 [Physella acuta]